MRSPRTTITDTFKQEQQTAFTIITNADGSSPLDPEDPETVVDKLLSDERASYYAKTNRGYFAATTYFEPANIETETYAVTSFAIIEKREDGLFLSFCDITDDLGNSACENRRASQGLVQVETPHPVFEMALKNITLLKFDPDGWLKLPDTEEEMSNLFGLIGELSALKSAFENVQTEASRYLGAQDTAFAFMQSIINNMTNHDIGNDLD